MYFNSEVKTITNGRYYLDESIEKVVNLLDAWINAGSGWVIYNVERIHINVANYEPLSGSSYIPLPEKLRNAMKVLINFKNKDHKCFLWCHIRFINPQNRNAERINADYELIENRFNLNVNVFGFDNKVYSIYVSKRFHIQVLNLVLIAHEKKLQHVFIKDFNKLMFPSAKHKDRKHFCMQCLQHFTTEEILDNNKKQNSVY